MEQQVTFTPDVERDLAAAQDIFGDAAGRLLDLLEASPLARLALVGYRDTLLELFREYRLRDPLPHERQASQLRLRLTHWVLRLVREFTEANWVFLRRLRTDGSVQLYGTPQPEHWHPENFYPPQVKGRGHGVSGKVLNRGHPGPEVIPDVTDRARNPFYDDHMRTLSEFVPGSAEHEFVSRIRGEFCEPIWAGNNVLAGIVGVSWDPFDDAKAGRIRFLLETTQEFISDLYYAGLQLERREQRENRIREIATYCVGRSAVGADVFLRHMLTILTCEAGLRWHRAMVFLFEDEYPSPARCVAALGGTGAGWWGRGHEGLKGKTLAEYLAAAASPDYAAADPLYQLPARFPDLAVFPPADVVGLTPVGRLFAAGSGGGPVEGFVQVEPTDPWLTRRPWAPFAFAGGARTSPHYLFPICRPASRRPLGFVLLDNPYPHPVEIRPDIDGTVVQVERFAGEILERDLTGRYAFQLPTVTTPASPATARTQADFRDRVERAAERIGEPIQEALASGRAPAEKAA